MKQKSLLVLITISLFLVFTSTAKALVIDFEDLSDLEPVTNQYSSLGVDFFGATALTAGISLNEFEIPPYSGTNVVYDELGPITVTFSTPMLDVGGYFTYLLPVTITAYDSSGSIVDTVSSTYLSNMALSGESGSSPNELLQVAYAGGISWVEIAGDLLGGSFTMDDFGGTGGTSIPDPATVLFLGTAMATMVFFRKKKFGRLS